MNYIDRLKLAKEEAKNEYVSIDEKIREYNQLINDREDIEFSINKIQSIDPATIDDVIIRFNQSESTNSGGFATNFKSELKLLLLRNLEYHLREINFKISEYEKEEEE